MSHYRSAVSRPAVRYHGGKWRLAPWIIQHLPPHRVYVEPFGGGASVLLRKERSYSEVYNDLDGEMVNLFRVIRDRGDALAVALRLTPFARDEFVSAWNPDPDPLEQARRTIVRSFMGLGSASITKARVPAHLSRGGLEKSGWRANSNKVGGTPAHDWANYPDSLIATIERMQGVMVENRPAIDVVRQHDGAGTAFYCDPPYVSATRDKGGDYRHEMTDQDHIDFARVLHSIKGMIVLSGYRNELYEDLYRGWSRFDRHATADGAGKRVESLWLNAASLAALGQQSLIV